MKKFKQLLCLALALTISASLLAACGQKDNGGSKDSDEKVLTYAVEGGSAGEEIALEKGWKVTTLEDQAAALMEVASGTSDAAIIDLLMAGAMIGEGTSYPDLTKAGFPSYMINNGLARMPSIDFMAPTVITYGSLPGASMEP